MFTGIVEQIAEVVGLKEEEGNIHISLTTPIANELKVDQSISHNGVCLTVVDIDNNKNSYTVTAINQTLRVSNLRLLELGSKVNIERSLKIGSRIDGHMVQGHIDQTAVCTELKQDNGSHIISFEYADSTNITVEKGSVCVNGVSLTVVNSLDNSFSVAIIPYTYTHTNLHMIRIGTEVNLEFDILGKYIAKMFIKDL